MFLLIEELINLKKLEMKEGEIRLLNTNLCLIPPDVYVLLQKELEKTKEEHILYELSKKSSFSWFKNLTKKMGKNENELMSYTPKIFNLLGLGSLEIKNSDFNKKHFEFYLYNSLTAERYGKSDNPVDIEVSGFIAGFLEFILKRKMICREKECMAQGLEKCLFVAN